MKTLSLPNNPKSFARHDGRAPHARAWVSRVESHFQPTAGDVAVATEPRPRLAKPDLRAFRKMSEELMAEEAHQNYWLELFALALVIGVVAWPLISLLIVLAQTANG